MLAVHSHLPPNQRTHFCQLKSAKALYDAIVKRYSSPSFAALGYLLLPYLFPELSDFSTIADLMPHLRSIYFLGTLLPDSLRPIRDHFLSLDPTELTLASFESRPLEAETSAHAVAASHGTPHTSFFEGCAPSLLVPSVASVAAVDFLGAEVAGAASTACGRRSKGGRQKGKGGGGADGGGGGGSEGGGGV
ncbi:unnamed protein product [Closterium sp. NIES-54]